MNRALGEQIMIDPDLVDENLASSAITTGTTDRTVPTPELGDKALADARAAALIELGGPGRMLHAPEPESGPAPFKGDYVVDGACFVQAVTTMKWAARMPPQFPVYPQAAVTDASGTDAADCAYRNIAFVTPVSAGEVMDYYFTRARHAGFSAQRWANGTDDVLFGGKGGASYQVNVRDTGSSATQVDLVTSGFSSP